MTLIIEHRAPSGEHDAEQFRAIYEASFLPEERDDTGLLLARVLDGTRDCYLAVDGERLLGLAVVLMLSGCPIAFLEYLAVGPEVRNAGIGGRILDHVHRELADTAWPVVEGLIFEVDGPEDARDTSERDLRERRIGFYRRHGAVVVDGARSYRAPAPSGDSLLSYLLMWLPVVPGMSPPAGTDLKTCVTSIFTQSYELREDTGIVRDLVAGIG
jgi:GNAT superfamily N-acetyltransferase